MKLAEITNASDLAAIAGETARHNKNFGTTLTDVQFFDGVFIANALKSWRHDHVNEDPQALKDRLQVIEAEKNAEKQRADAAEAEAAALREAAPK